jgi:hypothetical protein
MHTRSSILSPTALEPKEYGWNNTWRKRSTSMAILTSKTTPVATATS